MLYNLIQIFELATIVLLFLCVLRLFKTKDNETVLPKIETPFKSKYKPTKEQENEQRKLQQLLDNIDNYTGDSEGQKEVK